VLALVIDEAEVGSIELNIAKDKLKKKPIGKPKNTNPASN